MLGNRFKRISIAGLAVFLVIIAFTLYLLNEPYAGFSGQVLIEIPRGAPVTDIARLLEEKGVIRSRYLFLAVRLWCYGSVLQAGEYAFNRPATVWEVYRRIERGDIYAVTLVVPEGADRFDIVEILKDLGLPAAEDFLEVSANPELIQDLAPEAPSLEGYLFPDTYRIARKVTARELCEMMTRRFRQVWSSLGSASNVHEIVTIASLVEKETAIPEERPLVASVIYNRLERGMPLQIDPTVIYSARLLGKFRGTIYASDLKRDHAYNTYTNRGLPPGPIANPSLDSLRAALNPAQTDFLYFVARPDGSGRHIFSRTLSEHLRAVQQYRRGKRQEAEKVQKATTG